MKIKGNYVDVIKREIFKAEIEIRNQRILSVQTIQNCPDVYILPGIVDAHVHIESSMLTPQEFARIAVKHGTVASVSDPHEIANVMGVAGVDFMIKDASKTPFKFHFGAPSCVPATSFETAGYTLSSKEVEELLKRDEIKYLSEMMNFPGVIYNDEEVHKKLVAARLLNKPIDGHAPGLKGDDLVKYSNGGITTDHESTSAQEAIDKIKLGIKLQIREGSAAKNFDSLIEVIAQYPDDVMLCTDDCHPDDLIERHIIHQIKRAVLKGYDFFDVLRAATFNPIKHYNLEVGMLQTGDFADFIVVDNLKDFNVLQTCINGELVFDKGISLLKTRAIAPINNFSCAPVSAEDIMVKDQKKDIKVILAFDGDLYTGIEFASPLVENGCIISDVTKDVLKIVLVNRYTPSKPVVAFIKNFNLKKGAIAGSVAHDSHNIIAVGVSDEDIVVAINSVIESKGGIVAVNGDDVSKLELPIAGLMTNEDGYQVAEKYKFINQKPKDWGSTLRAPFMTLSFMALLVIPELKIGDKGLFDGKKFELTNLFSE
ncbi:MAG: adenine deaminase [Bacteroidales bacterium]|nr:adenine deaminase [Bacteroidales bacterium]